MAVTSTHVVVFDEVLYRGRGAVNVWMIKLTAQMHAYTREAAPKRTGLLAAGIDSEVRHVGVRQIEGVVGSTAPHTFYVLHGTGFPVKGRAGRIWTTKGFARRDTNGYVDLWKPVAPKDRRWPGERRRMVSVRLKGHYMAFGPDDHGPRVIAHTVAGQEPNNFLAEGYRRTARRHRALGQIPPSLLNL